MIVFLADVWLDSDKVIFKFLIIFYRSNLFEFKKVLEKLQTLFIGYSDCPPYAFVICGNFLSQPKYGLRTEELNGLYF